MKEVSIDSLCLNPKALISDEWMVLTVGTKSATPSRNTKAFVFL